MDSGEEFNNDYDFDDPDHEKSNTCSNCGCWLYDNEETTCNDCYRIGFFG